MKIKNWDKFQHFKHKTDMKWFKCYGRDLLNNIDWHKLNSENKATLLELWCLASEDSGHLPDIDTISFRLRQDITYIKERLANLADWLVDDEEPELYTTYITDKIRLEEIREDKIKEDKIRLNKSKSKSFIENL